MHFKWRYKICICSVILFKIESFRNYKVFSIIFPKILDDVLQNGMDFPDSSLHHIFEYKNLILAFLLFYKK